MKTSHCRNCNAEVFWATLATGKKIPLEPGAGFAGTYRITEGADGSVYAERIPMHSPASQDRHRNHLGTCPKKPARTRT